MISEALRGEGAYLIDHNMKRFMINLHERAELAPRDIVAKAIFERMNVSRKNYVYLDTRHLDKKNSYLIDSHRFMPTC